jgi:hypothetical protein
MSTAFENIVNLSNGKSDFTYKDIKKQCIIRGIDFEEVINGDVLRLSNWLIKNQTNTIDESLVLNFDNWLDKKLLADNLNYLIHPGLRLSHINKDDGAITIKANKKIKTLKPKREKDKSGLYKGTKKQYTFDLQRKGKSIDQVITKVSRKFPEAKVKSIKIWFNRSRKDNE